MGKKSLTKSTAKKKTATKKKTPTKNTEVKAAPKKAAAPKKGAKKAAAPKKTAAKKPAAKKPSLKSILKRDFGVWAPETLFTVAPDKDYLNNFTAPPLIDETDKEKVKKLKSLLAKQFDLSAPGKSVAGKAVADKPADAKKSGAEEKAKAEAEAKAKAEKEAEEKAKAEAEAKAKAEKEAAEKAKAEAEAKAKAEKEAEEKAKAEAEAKAKAEKEAEKPPAPPTPPIALKGQEPPEPPMNNALKMLIAIVGGLFLLLIVASAMNTKDYYLKATDKGVEIWQGKFSPSGKKLIMTVPDATIEEPVESVYTKNEALIPAFNYYISKAEALSEEKGILDFEKIKSNLYKAIKFAPTAQHKQEAKTRLNNIDFLFLIYKADVAAGKKTIEGYEAALGHLRSASALATDKSQKEMLGKKTNEFSEAIKNLKQEKASAEEAQKAKEAEAAAAALEKEKKAEENISKEAANSEQNTETPKANKH